MHSVRCNFKDSKGVMMMQKRFVVLGALVCVLSMLNSDRAQASYNYSTSLAITGTTGGAVAVNSAVGTVITLDGVVVTLSNVARTGFAVPSDSTVNIGDVAVSATNGPGTPVSFTATFSDVVTLTNVPPPGSATPNGTVTLTGTMTFTGVSTGTGIIANAYIIASGVTSAGTIPFSVAGSNFGNPTINGAPGNLGGRIIAGIPEPTSIVTLGLGIGALGIVALRRRVRSA
jgi:hypothetical protein